MLWSNLLRSLNTRSAYAERVFVFKYKELKLETFAELNC
jgi:hypothetical protein